MVLAQVKFFFLKTSPAPDSVYQYLCQQFPHIKPAEWQQRFTDALIYDAAGNILTVDAPYNENSHVFYYRFLAHEIPVPVEHKNFI